MGQPFFVGFVAFKLRANFGLFLAQSLHFRIGVQIA